MLKKLNKKKIVYLVSIGLHLFLLIVILVSLDSNPEIIDSSEQSITVKTVKWEDSAAAVKITATSHDMPRNEEHPLAKTSPPPPSPEPKNAVVVNNMKHIDVPPNIDPPKHEVIDIPKPEPVHSQQPSKSIIQHNHSSGVLERNISQELIQDLEQQLQKHTKEAKRPDQGEVKQQQETNIQEINSELSRLLNTQVTKSLESTLMRNKLSQHQQQKMEGIINKYKSLILQSISQQWVIPGHFSKEVYCELLIKLQPGGFVESVHLTRSSGNNLLDSSARAAVFRASPLPVPNNIVDFAPFKEFVLKVRPTDM